MYLIGHLMRHYLSSNAAIIWVAHFDITMQSIYVFDWTFDETLYIFQCCNYLVPIYVFVYILGFTQFERDCKMNTYVQTRRVYGATLKRL